MSSAGINAGIDLADTTYVSMPSFEGLSNTIISILGTLVFIILAVRIVVAYGKKQWGEMVVELIAAVFVFWFVFFPDNAKNTIKQVAQSIFGS